jgi:hypothetical protein
VYCEDTPASIQPTPPSESPVPSIPKKDVVPSRVLTRSIVVLAICIALTSLAMLLLIMLATMVFRKRQLVLCPREEMPLTGWKLKRMKSPNCRRGEIKCAVIPVVGPIGRRRI